MLQVPTSIKQLWRPHAHLSGGTLRLTDIAFTGRPNQVHGARRRYERTVEKYLGVSAALAYSSGRAAFMELLRGLRIGPGDEVIVPGYTCIVVPAAIKTIGATPVYADIDIETFNVLPDAVWRQVSPRTRAIVAQHTFGLPCDVPSLQEIARRQGAHLIEDCAHALGAKFSGVFCGNFGIGAFFSSEQSKMISTTKGGIATTNDEHLAAALRAREAHLDTISTDYLDNCVTRWRLFCFTCHPRLGGLAAKVISYAKTKHSFEQSMRDAVEFDHREYADAVRGILSNPATLSDRLAVLALPQMRRIEADIERRNRLARCLEPIGQRHGWRLPRIDWSTVRPSLVRYPFLTDERTHWARRFAEIGIDVGTWLDHPIHPMGSHYQQCGYVQGMCPNAEYVSQRVLNIPIHPRCADWLLDRLDGLKMA